MYVSPSERQTDSSSYLLVHSPDVAMVKAWGLRSRNQTQVSHIYGRDPAIRTIDPALQGWQKKVESWDLNPGTMLWDTVVSIGVLVARSNTCPKVKGLKMFLKWGLFYNIVLSTLIPNCSASNLTPCWCNGLKDGSSTWPPVTDMGKSDGVPGSWLQLGPALGLAAFGQ